MSKDKQLNNRIKQHIVTWCCDHRANLVAKDTSTEDDMETLNSVNLRLFDFVNASARINDLFKSLQVTTGEVSELKDALEMGDRPMHRWESSLKFYSTIMKLPFSIETLIREVLNRGWANNAKLTNVYAAHWLKEKYPRDEYLMFVAMQYDFISEVVHFINDNLPGKVLSIKHFITGFLIKKNQ